MSLSKLYCFLSLLFTVSSTGYPGYLFKFHKFKQNKVVINLGERSVWFQTHLEFSSFSYSEIPITNISEGNSGNKKVWKSFWIPSHKTD